MVLLLLVRLQSRHYWTLGSTFNSQQSTDRDEKKKKDRKTFDLFGIFGHFGHLLAAIDETDNSGEIDFGENRPKKSTPSIGQPQYEGML